jgi:hypothetical protein
LAVLTMPPENGFGIWMFTNYTGLDKHVCVGVIDISVFLCLVNVVPGSDRAE